MLAGRYVLYVALLKEFHYYAFTLSEAVDVQKRNLLPFNHSYVYSNTCGEMARFIIEKRAKRITKGVYRLSPTDKDVEVCLKAVPRTPGIILEATHRETLRRWVNEGLTSHKIEDEFIPKKPRRPVMVYSVTLESGETYTVGKAEKLLSYYSDRLTDVQKNAVSTGKVGKWIGDVNVIARQI